MSLESLPNELLKKITQFLEPKEYMRLHYTSRLLYSKRKPFNFLPYNEDLHDFLREAPLEVVESMEITEWTEKAIVVAFVRGLPQCYDLIRNGQVTDQWYTLDSKNAPKHLCKTPYYGDDTPETILTLCAMHGHNELIELLLDNGFGVNEENGYDVKPLGCAIVEHHPDTCRLLIERGADLDYAGFSSSAMHVAAEYSTPEILQMLVNAGQDVNLVEGDETPIHKVACYGTVENAQWLVEHGADLWMRGDSDLSVLDYSLYNSDSAVFEYLLQRYLESDPSEYWKEDALTNAAHACNFKACQKLLDLGANVNGNPQSSKTPLYNSVHGGHHGTRLQSIYDILMEHGADLYVGDASKECVLKNAAASNQTDIMEALIKRDPRIVEWSCREGYYGALHTAVQSGRIEASQLLLKHGANINVTDEEGRTPLMIATHNAGLESLRTCLKLGQIYRSETIMDGV